MDKNVNALLGVYKGLGGSESDTYSDIAGGIPVGNYNVIPDLIEAIAQKVPSGGSGGSGISALYSHKIVNTDTAASLCDAIFEALDGHIAVCAKIGNTRFAITFCADGGLQLFSEVMVSASGGSATCKETLLIFTSREGTKSVDYLTGACGGEFVAKGIADFLTVFEDKDFEIYGA